MKQLKKLVCALGILTSAGISAQQFGISAHGLMSFQPNQDIPVPMSDRVMKSGTAPAPGFRFETNYLLPGYGSFPIAAYSGLAIMYIAPATDSVVYSARRISGPFGGDNIDIVGTERISTFGISLRFGYEIPQDFNEFLMINYGGGMGYIRYTRQYVLPEQSATFTLTEDDFEAETFAKQSKGSFGLEIFAGCVYELERFSLIGQYSALLPMSAGSGSDILRLRHGFSVGLFYPLADFR